MPSHIPPPTTLPPGSIVDAYVRDSGGPRQQDSTDQQLAEIQKYCQAYGLNLRHKFADVAKSGSSTTARDEFNNLIDTTRRVEDRPQGILLWNYARFARDLDDAIYYKALLRNRNVVVHSLTDPIPEGQYGRIVEFFIDISNEEKRRQTSTDAKRGLRELVLKHGCVPGTPPLGFKRELVNIGTRRDGSPHTAHRWVPDPELVPRIARAFEMRASGHTLSQIHDQLHIYGAINSYKTFFANRIYIGILEFGDLVIENYCAPFTDMNTWNAVQEIIRDYARARTAERHPTRINSPYLLSGLVYCAYCDSPMFGNTATRHYITGRDEAYRCSRSRRRRDCDASRINRHKLEEAIFETLCEHILLPESLAAMLEVEAASADHHETHRQERIETLNAEKKKLSSNIANIARAIADRGHSATLLDKLSELEARRATISNEQAELSKVRYSTVPSLSESEIAQYSAAMTQKIMEAPAEEVRQFLQGFIKNIKVKYEKNGSGITGTITYYTPISEEAASHSPPFGTPAESATGYNKLLVRRYSLGAPLYRQIIKVLIVLHPKKGPRSFA